MAHTRREADTSSKVGAWPVAKDQRPRPGTRYVSLNQQQHEGGRGVVGPRDQECRRIWLWKLMPNLQR